MANKLKTAVLVNAETGYADLEVELTPAQAVVLLECVMGERLVTISLNTPDPEPSSVRDTPLAYAS